MRWRRRHRAAHTAGFRHVLASFDGLFLALGALSVTPRASRRFASSWSSRALSAGTGTSSLTPASERTTGETDFEAKLGELLSNVAYDLVGSALDSNRGR